MSKLGGSLMPLDNGRWAENRSFYRSKSTSDDEDDEILSLLDTPAQKPLKRVTFKTDTDDVRDRPDGKVDQGSAERRRDSITQGGDYRLADVLDRALSGRRNEDSTANPSAHPTNKNVDKSSEVTSQALPASIIQSEQPLVNDAKFSESNERDTPSYVPSNGRPRRGRVNNNATRSFSVLGDEDAQPPLRQGTREESPLYSISGTNESVAQGALNSSAPNSSSTSSQNNAESTDKNEGMEAKSAKQAFTISTRRSQIEALGESLAEKDAVIYKLRDEHESTKRELQQLKIQHTRELEELRGTHQGERLQLRNQIDRLDNELMRARQNISHEETLKKEIEEKYKDERLRSQVEHEEHMKSWQSKTEYQLKQLSDNQLRILDQISLSYRQIAEKAASANDQDISKAVTMALSKLKTVESQWSGALNSVRLERKSELEAHEELLKEMERKLTNISAEMSRPSDKIGNDVKTVLKTVHELQTFATVEHKELLELFVKERARLLEQLAFYQNEKRRYADEGIALKQELQLCKGELARERDKLEAQTASSLRQKEENERRLRFEEERLRQAQEELTRDILHLENRLASSRKELLMADSNRRELRTLTENLEQEKMRAESTARELCTFSDVLSKRSEEIEYLFQLAREAQDHATKEREKLNDEARRVETATTKAQTEKYVLVRERLEFLRERSSVRTFVPFHPAQNTEMTHEAGRQGGNLLPLLDSSPTNAHRSLEYNVFSSSALSSIKNTLEVLPGLIEGIGPKNLRSSLALRTSRKSFLTTHI